MDCIYDRVVAIYSRTRHGQLVHYFGKHATLLEENWDSIRSSLGFHAATSYRQVFGIRSVEPSLQSICACVDAHEVPSPQGSRLIGVLLRSSDNESSSASFDEYFSRVLLQHAAESFLLHETSQITKNASIAEKLVDLCEKELLLHPPNSQFEVTGRSHLLQKIDFFTSRGISIRMCLPAFPCKSSNLEKVGGVLPDRGEELALRRLYYVLREIESVYKPGARLCIISDGHVFSDCIGVDDDQVDVYGDRLHELSQIIGAQTGQTDQITFKTLKDIFNRSPAEILGKPLAAQIPFPKLNHYFDTKISPVTEFCRQAMTLGCQPNGEFLQSQIRSQDPSIISLYRGFSRFMLEDLALHPQSQCQKAKERRPQ